MYRSVLLVVTLVMTLVGCDKKPEQPDSTSAESGSEKREETRAPTDAQPVSITVGEKTTWVTKPVGENGRVDFVEAVNSLAMPVQENENAVTLLLEALGSGLEMANDHEAFVKRFGGSGRIVQQSDKIPSQSDFAKANEIEYDSFYDDCAAATSKPWTREQFPDVHKWVARSEAGLELCVAATRRSKYFYPLVSDLDEETRKLVTPLTGVLLPLPQQTRQVARALAARAMLRAGEGDQAGAISDIVALARLGRLLQQGSTVIEFLIGIATERIADLCVVGYINSGLLDFSGAERLLRELADVPETRRVAEIVHGTERLSAIDSLVAIADHGPSVLSMVADLKMDPAKFDARRVDFDQALITINTWYDRLDAALAKPTFREQQTALEQLEQRVKVAAKGSAAKVAQLFAGSATDRGTAGKQLADVIAGLMLPALTMVHEAETRSLATRQLTVVSLEVHRRRETEPSYQATIESLPPDLQRDPFTGNPIIVQTVGNTLKIYSLGPNGKDDGGPETETSTGISDDIGWTLSVD